MRAVNILLFICIVFLPSLSAAQYYNIHTWESFENGAVPRTLALGHQADAQTVVVFPYGIQGTPKEMLTETSSFECGKYGLSFFPNPQKKHLSVFSPISLDRSKLGPNGHALYQADFFLPAAGEPMPTIGLLAAVANPDNSLSYQIYRFGILDGGTQVYFSYIYDAVNQPAIFANQKLSEFNLKRPGWHRFQIIFKGPEEIYCAIDRVQTSFSPIRDATLQKMNPGIMVTYRTNPAPIVADNLSIQWSAEEVPLPDSPWVPRVIQKDTNLLADGSPLPWFKNPSQAWTVASAQKRPLFVMFYSPKVTPYEYLLKICPNDQGTNDILQRHILARVDANQLWGAALAQKMNVSRIPTLIVMGPDGKELGRTEVVREQTQWPQITKALWPGGVAAAGAPGN